MRVTVVTEVTFGAHCFNMVGVMRAVAVQLFRSEVDPRGVHHLRVTVAYSQPSFCVCTNSAPSVTVF